MSRVDIKIEGLDDLFADLNRLGELSDDLIMDTINDVAMDTQQEAVRSIQRGPKTGTIYYRIYDPETGWTNIYAGDSEGYITSIKGRANLSETHQSSAAGEAPASDTGRLASNVDMILATPSKLLSKVGTNIIYGAYLEFGTIKMAARPWLEPSFRKATEGVAKELKAKLEARI